MGCGKGQACRVYAKPHATEGAETYRTTQVVLSVHWESGRVDMSLLLVRLRGMWTWSCHCQGRTELATKRRRGTINSIIITQRIRQRRHRYRASPSPSPFAAHLTSIPKLVRIQMLIESHGPGGRPRHATTRRRRQIMIRRAVHGESGAISIYADNVL